MRLRTQMRKQLGPLSELILYLGGGFLSTLLILDGRAPAAIALLSVCRGSVRMLCVLCGSVLGALAAMDFTATMPIVAVHILPDPGTDTIGIVAVPLIFHSVVA